MKQFDVSWDTLKELSEKYEEFRREKRFYYSLGMQGFANFLSHHTGRTVCIDAPMDEGKYEYIHCWVQCVDEADFVQWKLTWF